LSSNVQSTNLLMNYTTCPFWTMRQSNDCLTPAPGSSAVKQWFERTGSSDEVRIFLLFKLMAKWHHLTMQWKWTFTKCITSFYTRAWRGQPGYVPRIIKEVSPVKWNDKS